MNLKGMLVVLPTGIFQIQKKGKIEMKNSAAPKTSEYLHAS
jgi:hypothetical protein